MEWEVNNDNSEAAKRVFYRAINACPWSKRIWLDGLRLLAVKGVLDSRQAGELLDMMRERGLRCRTDIYEILLEAELD